MLTLRSSGLPGAFGIIGLRQTAIPGATTPDEVIDGFPEFAFTVDTIKDPEVKAKLRKLAKRIVTSHGTGNRIIGFEVHGHSDQTMRVKAGPERDRTEMEVSRDRAEHCKELLLEMIKEEGGEQIITGIKANATAKAFGSKHRVFRPANTEPQMKKNRRVEIFLKEFINPPPKPTPPPAPKPSPTPDIGSNWSIQIIEGSTLTAAVPIPGNELSSFSIRLTVEVIDKDRKQKVKFRLLATGTALLSVSPIPGQNAASSVVVTKGSVITFATTKGVTLDRFVGDVDVAQDPGAGVSVLSKGGNFNFSFRSVEAIGAFVRPSVVSVDAGQGATTMPSAGLGGLTTGKLSMVGSPAPL